MFKGEVKGMCHTSELHLNLVSGDRVYESFDHRVCHGEHSRSIHHEHLVQTFGIVVLIQIDNLTDGAMKRGNSSSKSRAGMLRCRTKKGSG